MDFSTILQSPQMRAVVQENILERSFHDALFPRQLFRAEVKPVKWPSGIGDTMLFSAPGLMEVDARPLVPGQDPEVGTYAMEQWSAQLNQYAKSIDTHMPTSIVAIVDLFLRNAHQLGMHAAQTLNRIVRNRMYASALSGWTVANGAAAATTSLKVKRLNGFTRARNATSGTGTNKVRFEQVSASNPLSITLFDNATVTTNTVVGYTPDTPGDEFGPGTLILGSACTNVLDRAYVFSSDATSIVRVGGGFKVDDIGSADIPTLADVRTAIANFWQQNVPEHADGRFHCHMDPTSQTKIFADSEFQRLMTALPDYYAMKQFALGELLNCVFYRNSECPVPETVVGGSTAAYDAKDPFAGELYNNGLTTGVKIHRMLFTAQGACQEYYNDMADLLTEAGITGKVGEPRVVNNGIEIDSERVQLIFRSPLNRLQDTVSASWKFIGDWVVRTDAATGNASRYKRTAVVEHGE